MEGKGLRPSQAQAQGYQVISKALVLAVLPGKPSEKSQKGRDA